MKKLGLLLFAALGMVLFVACNDSDGDYPQRSAFATVKTLENNDYYFVLDDQTTIYPSDKSRIGSYNAKDDQRVIIAFTLLRDGIDGYDYNMAIYLIQNIYSGETVVIKTQDELEALADDQTSYLGANIEGDFLNVGVGFSASDLKKHQFKLVLNEVPAEEVQDSDISDKYQTLELRRDANGDNGGYNYENLYVSFKLDEFKEQLDGKQGIILRVNTRFNGVKLIAIDLPKK